MYLVSCNPSKGLTTFSKIDQRHLNQLYEQFRLISPYLSVPLQGFLTDHLGLPLLS